jgi:heme-degrading monooxygenase HmoA
MYASIITTTIQPGMADEFAAAWQAVIGGGNPPDGWQQGYLVINHATNEVVSFGVWDSEAHASAYETSGRFREDAMKLARFRSDDNSKPPTRQIGEIAVFVGR